MDDDEQRHTTALFLVELPQTHKLQAFLPFTGPAQVDYKEASQPLNAAIS